MEIKKGGQSLIGYPALIDKGTHVEIEVFDEPEAAAEKHRAGLRRLVALAAARRDQVPREEHPRPAEDDRRLHDAGRRRASCATQIVELALDRAFLAEPLPADAAAFARRVEEGRGRLTLIAGEVARIAAAILVELRRGAARSSRMRGRRRTSPTTSPRSSSAWCRSASSRRRRGCGSARCRAISKAVVMRLDKLRADPARDAARLAELRPLEQRYARKLAERRGARDARLEEFRWWLEELRVGLFAQELKTPQPVSVKRLEKIWAQTFRLRRRVGARRIRHERLRPSASFFDASVARRALGRRARHAARDRCRRPALPAHGQPARADGRRRRRAAGAGPRLAHRRRRADEADPRHQPRVRPDARAGGAALARSPRHRLQGDLGRRQHARSASW